MIKMSIGLVRLPHLDSSGFRDYWLNQHAPLVGSVSRVLGIRRYVQLHTLPEESGLPSSQGVVFDGVAEVWFDDIETVTVGHREPDARAAARKLREDEERFVDRSRSVVWWGTELVIL